MAGSSNRFSRFWQELKRRKTDRVIVLYAATAFVILELVDILSPAILPEWSLTFILVLLIIGFPLAIIFSWVFDVTPISIEKTRPLSDKKKRTKKRELRTWQGTTLISVIIIISLLIYNVIKGFGTFNIGKTEKSIAVLPFDNLSEDKSYHWLGDAMTEEITMQLQKIRNFDVRSRTSVMQYRENRKKSSEIGKELNVNFLLEGSVQMFGEMVRIHVQLIHAGRDNHIWGDSYDNSWDDILSVQKRIAKEIASQLKTVLTPEEIEDINRNPTASSRAYSSYLTGNRYSDDAWYYFMRGKRYSDSTSFRNALLEYDKAIQYDSLFALAYAKRAINLALGYYTGIFDHNSVSKCRQDIDRAMRLEPGMAEARLALGLYYYYCRNDYQEALRHFRIASDQNPEYWESLFYMAMVQRRNGNWKESQRLLSRVLRYNPMDALILTNIGLSYQYLRIYDTAVAYHNRASEIMPKWTAPYENRIVACLTRYGSTDKARALLDSTVHATGDSMKMMRISLDIYDRKFREALRKAEELSPSDFIESGERDLLFARIYKFNGNDKEAEKYYYSALELYKKQLGGDPENPSFWSSLAISCAGLNNKVSAIEAAERAIYLSKNDMMARNDYILILARIFVMFGEYEAAAGQIEHLLNNPSLVSIRYLHLDPVWEPLLNTEGFRNIIAKYSKI